MVNMMPKTRLNRDKRDVLHHLAAKAVEATPIDPAIERRVAKAQAAYDKSHDARASEVLVIVAKKYPAHDIRVLAKYKLVRKVNEVLFVGLDDRVHFNVKLFNAKKWDRENVSVASERHDYEERNRRALLRKKAEAEAAVEIPYCVNAGVYGNKSAALEATAKLVKLAGKFTDIREELSLAERADKDKRENIRCDFVALIEGSHTFEDVIGAWPEAKQVTDQIVGAGRAVSLVSQEAVERIQANMKSRNVEV